MRIVAAFFMVILVSAGLSLNSISNSFENVNFQKGISFTGWEGNNIYNTPVSGESLKKLAETGANYVALTSR